MGDKQVCIGSGFKVGLVIIIPNVCPYYSAIWVCIGAGSVNVGLGSKSIVDLIHRLDGCDIDSVIDITSSDSVPEAAFL